MISGPVFATFGAHATRWATTFLKELNMVSQLFEPYRAAQACYASANKGDRLVGLLSHCLVE
jgi:hypothetical protein